MTKRMFAVGALSFFVAASAALASWYDDYDAGLNAARRGNWAMVIQKMTAAIKQNPKENDRAREYGTIFINYHPYYYRGVAYLNTGNFEGAISDFEKAEGIGDENLGSIEINMGRAKQKLAAAQAAETPATPQPQPQPRQVVPVPQPVQPAAPVIDPALRGRAQATINQANQSIANARGRNAASSPMYANAVNAVAQANTRIATAKSNDDLNAAMALAQNAMTFADAAVPPGQPTPPVQIAHVPPPTRPVAASSMVMGDATRRVRLALESYFRGDFDEAAAAFEKLSNDMPTNGWIFAFLGASKYSQYAFETDEKYKVDALAAFRRAKQLRTFRNGLPPKYFSKRIRRAFEGAG